MKIRLSILTLIIGIGLLTNCDNTDDDNSQPEFESTAKITGYDSGACFCCGGKIIDIDGEDPSKRFSELPENSNIDIPNMTFPISVRLNWSESNQYCGRGIIIESIELIE
ncbi:hypothetical protein FBALC1_06323 [Flavobacteriales bacterium ALC-1]|nr:hypothetical protein FBALC1_06323 [Flavobacteriales bacterium ALC-1]